eukprot:Sspe_Gene.44914::Locus_22101_Transcript_2_3_Confidence_0.400_Length_1514::g.44914::m.44914
MAWTMGDSPATFFHSGLPATDEPAPASKHTNGVLTLRNRQLLSHALPLRYQYCRWRQLYNTREDGMSSTELLRRSEQSRALVLAVSTLEGERIGAFLPEHLSPKGHYYGSPETFLWSFVNNEPKWYRSTQSNGFFVHVSVDGGVYFGGGGGVGLSLPSGLCKGATQRCATYNNPPLTPRGTFEVHAVELWGLDPVDIDDMSAGSPLDAPPSEGSTGWSCVRCTHENNVSAAACEGCAGPPALEGGDEWLCPCCTFENLATDMHCIACGSGRDDEDLVRSPVTFYV